MNKKSHPLVLFICIASAILQFSTLATAIALESVRNQEIAECKPTEIVTWLDGVDRPAASSLLLFRYRHQGSPHWFMEDQVSRLVKRAATAWSQCGIEAYLVPYRQIDETGSFVTVQWDERESRGNFALANLTQRTLSLNPKGFELLRSRNPKYDASLTLQMTISHEMGHFFGLMAHSRRCVDVMSYYHNGKGDICYKRPPTANSANDANKVVEYRHILPTSCDIERCRRINGKSPLPGGRLPQPP